MDETKPRELIEATIAVPRRQSDPPVLVLVLESNPIPRPEELSLKTSQYVVDVTDAIGLAIQILEIAKQEANKLFPSPPPDQIQ